MLEVLRRGSHRRGNGSALVPELLEKYLMWVSIAAIVVVALLLHAIGERY